MQPRQWCTPLLGRHRSGSRPWPMSYTSARSPPRCYRSERIRQCAAPILPPPLRGARRSVSHNLPRLTRRGFFVGAAKGLTFLMPTAEIVSPSNDFGGWSIAVADGVGIHGANGYLPRQFLAPSAHVRTDAYGGSSRGPQLPRRALTPQSVNLKKARSAAVRVPRSECRGQSAAVRPPPEPAPRQPCAKPRHRPAARAAAGCSAHGPTGAR